MTTERATILSSRAASEEVQAVTMPCYPQGCTAESEVRGIASAANPQSNAWNVNLNNGNANTWNQNNNGLALSVCGPFPSPGEYRDATLFEALFKAWQRARKQKCSAGQLRFEAHLLDNLLELERQILELRWKPQPSVCFIAQRPKARQIHAPAFADRVLHHLVVPILEADWEPRFIHDCYSNRKGKGTHAAVQRVWQHMRQVQDGQGDGWSLKLDVKNFFNTIDRRKVWARIKRVLEKRGAPAWLLAVVRALLQQSAAHDGVRHLATAAEQARVPPHKRLENAAPGCGLAIGNLSSQFFANVCLDEVDQFIKHELKVPRYVRYVDDMVLVHKDREQLLVWQARIEEFLRERLGLELKEEKILKPLRSGCDFLGYVIYPSHLQVRPRVIHHAREALQAWQARHVRGNACRGTPEAFRRGRAVWTSYEGHLAHASARRMRERLLGEFPWLPAVAARRRFHHRLEGRPVTIGIQEPPG